MAELVFPTNKRPSLAWQQNATQMALTFGNVTTFLDGEDLLLGGWGLYRDTPDVPPSAYVSAAWTPIPTICNEGLVGPFGIASVAGFEAPAGISNPPPPGSGRIAPRQSATIDTGSAGLLTVSGVGSRTLDLSGAIDVDLTSCNAQGCVATLSGLNVMAAPFTFGGYDVQHIRLTARDAATGALNGNTLAFPGFTGAFEVRLKDGRYDNVPARTGALLANWDVLNHRFVMAFSFSGTLDDGTSIDLTGSAFGRIYNTAPKARIEVISPTLSSTDPNVAYIECTTPSGTNVLVDSTASSDLEDSRVSVAWFQGGVRQRNDAEFTAENLPLGDSEVELMAYDSLGYATNDRLTLRVVDTTGPQIVATDLCVSPPNHSMAVFRLGEELSVAAVDACDASVTNGSVRIVDVTSSTGDGVVRWNDLEACLAVERSGTEPAGRTYDVTVEATDASGNTSRRTIHVDIPRGVPQACKQTRLLAACE
jgi:hypothetical protein